MPRTRIRETLGCIAIAAFASGIVACQPAPVRPTDPAAEAEARAQLLARLDREHSQLAVFITDQTTDGRNILLRGLVLNPYDVPVDGVRVVFRSTSEAAAGSRELDRFQKVMEVNIAGGARTALRWDVQTMYAGSAHSNFSLQAYAIKRGGEDVPPPPGWKE